MMTATTYRSAGGGWISADSAARETAAITRALQISISGAGGGGGEGSSLASSSSSLSAAAAATPTSSDAAAAASISPFLAFDRGGAARMAVQEKKIKKKRKSRAKAVDRTVYINTDPANFRWMVQQATGIQTGSPAVGTVLMPEPRRAVAGAGDAPVLPTLDTSSAFVMERAGPMCGAIEQGWMEAPSTIPSFHFPTLASWSVM